MAFPSGDGQLRKFSVSRVVFANAFRHGNYACNLLESIAELTLISYEMCGGHNYITSTLNQVRKHAEYGVVSSDYI